MSTRIKYIPDLITSLVEVSQQEAANNQDLLRLIVNLLNTIELQCREITDEEIDQDDGSIV